MMTHDDIWYEWECLLSSHSISMFFTLWYCKEKYDFLFDKYCSLQLQSVSSYQCINMVICFKICVYFFIAKCKNWYVKQKTHLQPAGQGESQHPFNIKYSSEEMLQTHNTTNPCAVWDASHVFVPFFQFNCTLYGALRDICFQTGDAVKYKIKSHNKV